MMRTEQLEARAARPVGAAPRPNGGAVGDWVDRRPAADAPAPAADRLRQVEFLAGADPAALAAAARHAAWRDCEPGEVLVDFEDAATEVFLVVQGHVRVVVRTPAGRELILNEFGPGELFGEIAAIDGKPRSASITAVTRARLCTLPAADFLDIVHASPRVSLRLLRLLAGKLRLQTERALERDALSVRLRLVAELLRLSRTRGDGTETRMVSPPVPQHELASRIGARREVVSRALTELAGDGLVAKTRGALLLPRPDALRHMVAAGLAESGA